MGAVIGSRWRIRRRVRGTEQEDRGGLTRSDSLLHPFPKMPQWTHLPQEAQQETVRLLAQLLRQHRHGRFCRNKKVMAKQGNLARMT